MAVKLLTEHDLEFLSLTGGCTGSLESTPVKYPHCWKSYVAAQIDIDPFFTVCMVKLIEDIKTLPDFLHQP